MKNLSKMATATVNAMYGQARRHRPVTPTHAKGRRSHPHQASWCEPLRVLRRLMRRRPDLKHKMGKCWDLHRALTHGWVRGPVATDRIQHIMNEIEWTWDRPVHIQKNRCTRYPVARARTGSVDKSGKRRHLASIMDTGTRCAQEACLYGVRTRNQLLRCHESLANQDAEGRTRGLL